MPQWCQCSFLSDWTLSVALARVSLSTQTSQERVTLHCMYVSSSMGIAHLFQCWWRYREIVSRLRWVLVLRWLSADAPNQLHRRQRKNPTPKKLISFCRSCYRIGRWCFLCYLRSLWSPFVDHFLILTCSALAFARWLHEITGDTCQAHRNRVLFLHN